MNDRKTQGFPCFCLLGGRDRRIPTPRLSSGRPGNDRRNPCPELSALKKHGNHTISRVSTAFTPKTHPRILSRRPNLSCAAGNPSAVLPMATPPQLESEGDRNECYSGAGEHNRTQAGRCEGHWLEVLLLISSRLPTFRRWEDARADQTRFPCPLGLGRNRPLDCSRVPLLSEGKQPMKCNCKIPCKACRCGVAEGERIN